MIVNVDIESRSTTPLRTAGLTRYARGKSPGDTEIVIVQLSVDGGDVWGWDITQPQRLRSEVVRIMRGADILRAWNAPFEATMFEWCWGLDIPVTRWECTMARSLACGYPASLEQASAVLGLGSDGKDKDGKRLIAKFSKPGRITKKKPDGWSTPKTDPEDWVKFVSYCKQDVRAEQAIHKRLAEFDQPYCERDYWLTDQRINRRGLPVDMQLVQSALALCDKSERSLARQMRAITGLENPNSVPQLLKWLQDHGYDQNSLAKAAITAYLEAHHG